MVIETGFMRAIAGQTQNEVILETSNFSANKVCKVFHLPYIKIKHGHLIKGWGKSKKKTMHFMSHHTWMGRGVFGTDREGLKSS